MKVSANFLLAKDQISVLVAKNFKVKYNASLLGFAWCIVVPVVMSLVYFFSFRLMMRGGRMPNYLLYLISGNFLWHFFAGVVGISGRILIGNATLLKKTNFNRELLIWSSFFTEGMHFLLTIPILIVIMLCYRVTPQFWSILPNLAVSLVSLTLLATGIAFFVSATNLLLRDVERFMAILLTAWLFLSPVFIPAGLIIRRYPLLCQLNPMTGILIAWRNIFYSPGFEPRYYLAPLVISTLVFVIGRWTFRRNDAKFAEML